MNIAEQIRALREKQERSQRELGEAMGATQQAWQRLETLDDHQFTVGTLQKVADALGVELHIYLGSRKPKGA